MNNKFLSPSAHFVMPDAPFGDPHYNLAVWGTSGSGKTALLQPILQSMREQLGQVNEAELAAVPEDKRWLVTSEGAFSYLARDFGLKELFLWPINADQQGTPQQVRKVIDAMREHSIGVIFSESTISPAPAEQVARETGAKYGGVLYVDSLTEADGPVPTYIDLLRITSETIAKGLTE